ncbi:MAG TPA: rhomboid family intramembrane serine protease [Propionicimonas sp.]|nr:rhomboid family intramembrane serine protease [Propionicimonas sp.]HRA06552.1 rhomboid family intramembrane serine protease [Propionicimonas sp.]
MTQPQPQPPVAYGCYRHPDRPTYIGCQRCGRPICGDCMISAAVGFQCPDCVAAGAKQTRQHELPYGGTRVANTHVTTLTLIALNVAIWVLYLATGGSGSSLASKMLLLPSGQCASVEQPGAYFPGIGAEMCQGNALVNWVPGVADGAWWQLLTSAFSHLDVVHLLMNMVSLWFLGPPLEMALGRVRFLAVYLISALSGSALVMWASDPSSQTLGASGAIFGLLGALLVLAYKVRGDYRTVLMWLAINLAYTFGFGSNISWQGHVGGLVGGVVMAAIIVFAPRKDRARTQLLGAIGFVVLLLVLIAVRVAQLT